MTAARKRRRMGRPRLPTRPPSSGHARDKQREQNAVSVAQEARQRHFGARPDEAAHVEWESALGRLYKWEQGEAERRYRVADRYRKMRVEYDRIMGVRPLRSGSDLHPRNGHDDGDGTDPAHRERDARVRDLYRRCFLALLATGSSEALSILERVAVEDKPPTYPMLPTWRLAVDAVARVLD